jgi:hypothetical protein
MRVIVTGGREYRDKKHVYTVLDELNQEHGITELIHGGAYGADSHAAVWAADRNIPATEFRANWKRDGKRAGMIRNTEMAAYGADLCVAFPGGKGTAHMARAAKMVGIRVYYA